MKMRQLILLLCLCLLIAACRGAEPQEDEGTDDFLTTAVALTIGNDPETKQYGYVPQEFEVNDLTAFLERLGAQFLDESTDPPKLAFSHPDMIEAMRWVTNLTSEFSVKPTFITNAGAFDVEAGEERKTLIENGRAAMWSDQGFQSFPEIYLDHLDIGRVPLPVGPDGTAQRQACWEWIKFLSEQPLTGGFGNSVPARRSVAQSAAYAQAVGEEQAAVNLSSVENVTGPSIGLHFTTDANWLATGFY